MRLAALCRSGPRSGRPARQRLADGRTALSQHRRRSPTAGAPGTSASARGRSRGRRRRRHRRVGVFLVTAAAATVAVVAGALIVIIGRPQSFSDPLGAAIAQVSAGKTGASLIQERQRVILEDAATQSFSVTSKPKISIIAPPSAGAQIVNEPAPNPASAQLIAESSLVVMPASTSRCVGLHTQLKSASEKRYKSEDSSCAY